MRKLMRIAAAAAVLVFGFNASAQEKKAADGKKKDADAKSSGGASKGSNTREKAAEAKEVRPIEPARPQK